MKTLEEKLEKKFKDSERLYHRKGKRVAFLWTSQKGTDGVGYGSYKYVREDELALRKYILQESDYDVSIFYTDILHNPRTHEMEPIE